MNIVLIKPYYRCSKKTLFQTNESHDSCVLHPYKMAQKKNYLFMVQSHCYGKVAKIGHLQLNGAPKYGGTLGKMK